MQHFAPFSNHRFDVYIVYDQKFVRTMFFEKVETIMIDGQFFEISTGARYETYTAKEAMTEVYNYLDPERVRDECT